MKVLWLSMYPYLTEENDASNYHGMGWIASLQDSIEQMADGIDLGIAFLSQGKGEIRHGRTTFYPVPEEQKNRLQKLLYYWGGFKREKEFYVPETLEVIRDFKPDVIHIFGIESPFATMVAHTDVPIVVHLQGILNPCFNAFYPQGMNRCTFLLKSFSLNEWLLRNGSNFAYDEMRIRAKQEVTLFQHTKYLMGRTEWDLHLSKFFAPQSKYYHINEILRAPFYTAPAWKYSDSNRFTIFSTISETVYKGLDLILKTAQLLKQHTDIDFVWKVAGIDSNSKVVHFFEQHCQIRGRDVHTEYLGVLNDDQLCNSLRQADVYVHPSYIDNSPNSLCEAQLLGLPVVATYVGGVPSLVVNNETGLLVAANDPHELAWQLNNLLCYPEAMVRLGENARKTAVVRHSKEHVVADVMHAYQTIVNTHSCS